MLKHIALYFLALIGVTTVSNAQNKLAHEIGVFFGPVFFQSDYGQRKDFETNIGNNGFGVGVAHYLNFSSQADRDYYFNEHFKLRSELSFSKTNLQHFGEWVEKDPEKVKTQQLRAMRGKTTVLNFGTQVEFFPFIKIHEFENNPRSFNPYISLGVLASFYNTEATSLFGRLGDPSITYPKYLTPSDGRSNGFSSESGIVIAGTVGAGVHYKLNTMNDLMFEVKYQGFSSDWVDGLNPNKDLYKENKSNDSQIWFNIGYVHYLEF
jgi:hypothetical protein